MKKRHLMILNLSTYSQSLKQLDLFFFWLYKSKARKKINEEDV